MQSYPSAGEYVSSSIRALQQSRIGSTRIPEQEHSSLAIGITALVHRPPRLDITSSSRKCWAYRSRPRLQTSPWSLHRRSQTARTAWIASAVYPVVPPASFGSTATAPFSHALALSTSPRSNWNGMIVLWPAAGASPASAQKLSRRPQLAASPPKFHGLPLTCMHSWGRAESMGDGQGKEGVGLGVTGVPREGCPGMGLWSGEGLWSGVGRRSILGIGLSALHARSRRLRSPPPWPAS